MTDPRSHPDSRQGLRTARRIVVKIGSAVLAPEGELSPAAVARLVDDVEAVIRAGREVLLVSSGAVASGFKPLGLAKKPRTIVEKQAAAAVGQSRLMSAYSESFARHGRAVAQVLLTADDLDHRLRCLNARHTLEELLRRDIVPIINENDTVSFEEIKLGDNDNLSALVAVLMRAEALVVLSSVPGLLDRPGRVIPLVQRSDDALSHVTAARSTTGVGGMATKVAAAKLAGASGIPVVIAGGSTPGIVTRVLSGEAEGTLFEPSRARGGPARKRWIGYSARARGALLVDDGARRAIVERGASLLPAGIIAVAGSFDMGALVEVRTRAGEPFARGITSYSSDEIERIRGKKASEIAGILGYLYRDEIIHRDDMALSAG
jgi:glutamate 5-kinase